MFSKKRKHESISSEEETYVELPNDIVAEILQFVMWSDFKEILTLALVSKAFNKIVEALSNKLIEIFWGAIKNKLLEQKVHNSFRCTFFNLAEQEYKRLEIGKMYLKRLKESSTGVTQCPNFDITNATVINYSALHELRKEIINEIFNFDNNRFLSNHVITKDNIRLPTKLDWFILENVKARAYETLKNLIDTIKEKYSEDMFVDKIIDSIYRGVAYRYNAIELIQILHHSPIDLDRQIGDPIIGIGVDSYYKYKPFLHLAIEGNNVEIVTYLVENGADLEQLSSDGKNIPDQIEACIKWANDGNQFQNLGKLLDIQTYLCGHCLSPSSYS